MTEKNIISVSGIDGSGKTTIIDALSSALQKQGKNTRVIWLRYNHYSVKIVLAFARLFLFTTFEKHKDCVVSYHEFYRSRLLSHAFIWLTWLDTAVISFFAVRMASRAKNAVIICDRWIPDILIDLEIDTRMGLHEDNGFYHRLFWWLVPETAKILVIDRGFEDVLKARPEHPHDRNFETRYQLYKTLAKTKSLTVIDNTGSLDDTIHNTIKIVN